MIQSSFQHPSSTLIHIWHWVTMNVETSAIAIPFDVGSPLRPKVRPMSPHATRGQQTGAAPCMPHVSCFLYTGIADLQRYRFAAELALRRGLQSCVSCHMTLWRFAEAQLLLRLSRPFHLQLRGGVPRSGPDRNSATAVNDPGRREGPPDQDPSRTTP